MQLKTLLFSILIICAIPARARHTVDISGKWNFSLIDIPDSLTDRAVNHGTLTLPGTLDTAGAGIRVPESSETNNLSRRFTYMGPAVFSRRVTIPDYAADKTIFLNLERTRPATVKVDGIDAGFRTSISASQIFDLSSLLTPGEHLIEITVDNGASIPYDVRTSSHACTDATQTNWNGIIGDITLQITDPIHISALRLKPDIEKKAFIIDGEITKGNHDRPLYLTARSEDHEERVEIIPEATGEFIMTLPLGDDARLWSEWDPELYDIEITLKDHSGRLLDSVTRRSGLRQFATDGTHFTINGDITFLRGKHDACVWPLTGHVPMDMDSWRRYFSILKEYGINHVRFHSWCPPEACFAAADEIGVYLQPELSIWGAIEKNQSDLLEFLATDMEAILAQYAHHPSFVMFAIGNELWGETALMKDFIDKARETVPGLLATYGSNIYLGHMGHIDGEDFLVTCRVGDGEGFSTHARASFSFADAENGGLMNSTYPNTTMNFSKAVELSPVPVIGHETGQYQSYPDFSTIKKYKGALRPDNLKEFKRRAQEAGTIRKADAYAKASGAWATRLYKADMEMNLRTPEMGGFQLLDLQDYPGQGTALVGILDPFMDSKGYITPEEWRQSCGELTLLAELPGFTFTGGDKLKFNVLTADYSPEDLSGEIIDWQLPFISGQIPVKADKGLTQQESIEVTLPEVTLPEKMTLTLSMGNGNAANSYDIWVYPRKMNPVDGVKVTSDYREALRMLEHGDRVILAPDTATVAATTLPPLFQTDYWNYRMFYTICKNMGATPSPGTLGLLIDDAHPAFNYFPTDTHTDWQWFDIVTNSRPLIIDRLPASIDPIVEPIDNVDRNYRLALMLECNVGKGKLLIVMTDLKKIASTPEGQWFRKSLEEYVASKEFKPSLSLTPRQLTDLLIKPSTNRVLKELRNISYD